MLQAREKDNKQRKVKMEEENYTGTPCIRGLKRFEKTGCPGEWNEKTKKGCPACISNEYEETTEGNKKIKRLIACIDIWNHKFNYWHQGRLSGIHDAVISLRNASCEPDPKNPLNDNSARPKAPAEIAFLAQALNRVVELMVKGDTLQSKLLFEKMDSRIKQLESINPKQIEGLFKVLTE